MLVKKELFTIFLNWFEIALESLLWHIMSCCRYATRSPGSEEYVENIFGPIACIKNIFRRKTRKDGSFCNLILTPKGVFRYRKCCKKCWFSWFVELQRPLENFLDVKDTCSGYLEGPPGSGLSNAPTFMVIRCIGEKISPIYDFFGKKPTWDTLLNLTFLIVNFYFIWRQEEKE